jgi:hypothetical protein
MPVPEVITKLIERFDFHRQSHISPRTEYNETKLRQDYLDHFFIALGWDVYNNQGWSEQAREVSLEQPIKIQGRIDFIDYSFKIGKDLKFIAEAKSPKVRIKDNTNAAYQVRRYAWNAKQSLCLLTNFDEFAVYDCTKKPSSSDASSVARIEFFTFNEIPAKWDWIVSVFSKDAVYRGSFDRFAETTKGKKGTANVDDEFLTEIENWRDDLAKNIAIRNTKLSHEEVNYSVQTIIDRIIFLRICEDRGLEKAETLKVLLEREDVYTHLCDLFKQADTKYNSGIFYFQKEPDREEPDALTLFLKIDDKVLKGILKRLYYPESPYEFSVIPLAILGQVYEQFLGKIIRLTEGHQARVEYKPEVKKAGGVFYTPQYIVEYIVKHTVEELIKNKSPREVSKIRILDPACGSGSFLIGAYQSLLDWHLEWYVQNLAPLLNMKIPISDARVQGLLPEPPKRKKSGIPAELPIYPTGYSNGIQLKDRTRSDWALSTTEKKRILLNNIFGVDIDHQAVEVTKLSLLLKVLEGETEENIEKQLKLLSERALPSLHQNIKCGNSLIGTDILTPEMPNEEVKRINPFDWDREFPDVMKADGFDAVIGNPPYVRQEGLKEKKYFETHYKVYQGTADLYVYFIEKGLSLVRPNGQFSYIVANKWIRANYGKPLRKFLLTKQIDEIVDFGDLPVFTTAITYPCIIRVSQEKPVQKFWNVKMATLDFPNLDEYIMSNGNPIDSASLTDDGWTLGNIETENLLKKITSIGQPLETYVNGAIYYGIKTGLNKAFIIDENTKNKLIQADSKNAAIIKPFLIGKDISRYFPIKSNKFVIYLPWHFPLNDDPAITGASSKSENAFKQAYPAIYQYLLQFKDELLKRNAAETGIRYEWYTLQRFGSFYSKDFEKNKICWGNLSSESPFTIDDGGHYINAPACFLISDDILYLLGCRRGGFIEAKPMYVSKLPIRSINFAEPVDKARHDRMVTLVTQMLDLNKKLQEARLEQDKTMLSRQIEVTDVTIDRLVYELYGITEEEIKLVEEMVK